MMPPTESPRFFFVEDFGRQRRMQRVTRTVGHDVPHDGMTHERHAEPGAAICHRERCCSW